MMTAGADSPNSSPSRFFALIPCAGQGSRAGSPTAKQYQPVAGQALVLHTLAAFAAVGRVGKTLVVVAPGDSFFDQTASSPSFEVADCGGASRADSVRLITPAQIDRLIDACAGDSVGGLLALKLPDTLKREVGGRVAGTIDRADKWLAQTPQMFRLGALAKALQGAGDSTTDESSAMEAAGLQPKLVAGSAENFKVTYAEDFLLAEAILLSRRNRLNQQAAT
jgi:2-C-methyl-D-erythritol 4-phosphate cytidylyltransferase